MATGLQITLPSLVDMAQAQRSYRTFLEKPQPNPLAVVIQTEQDLTHKTVLDMVQQKLSSGTRTDYKVVSIQFVDLNVLYRSKAMPGRWVVVVDRQDTVWELLRGVSLNGQPIGVRRYDDVIRQEYNAYMSNQRRHQHRANPTACTKKYIAKVR